MLLPRTKLAMRIMFVMSGAAEVIARARDAAIAMALCCLVATAHAAGADMFSAFDSVDMNRQIHGHRSTVDLSAGSLRLGDASAFFGVDSLSNDVNHYLSSGLQWKSAGSGTPLLALGAMQTASRGATIAGQTLLRAEMQLAFDDVWYLPDLTFEADQFTGHGPADPVVAGTATRLGFGKDFGVGRYHVDYFQAGSDYNPWGSAIAAGARGLEMSGAFDLGSRWRLRHSVLIHDGDIVTGARYGLVDKWSLFAMSPPNPTWHPWRLSAQFGDAGVAGADRARPLSLTLVSRTRRWREWRIDSALGWYQGGIATPEALPIDGGLWRVSANHAFELYGLKTRFQPRFSIGGSRYDDRGLASRTGLTMGFPELLDNVTFNVDYLSAGWGPINNRPDMKMTLSITRNAGVVLPRLYSLVDWLRSPWFGLW